MNEPDYQQDLKKKIKALMPDAIVLKNDPNWLQGFPDLTILRGEKWAALEVKKDKHAKHRPNQDYYVGLANQMAYSSFIYPENEKEVLDGLQRALEH